jgi:hypothetical protein
MLKNDKLKKKKKKLERAMGETSVIRDIMALL